MKLIIQIPCFNEASTLPATLADLPRKVEGFDSVEWLIVDDGSSDDTVEAARRHGVDHVVSLPYNQGLARAYLAGLEGGIRAGADVIVNTDADNQYHAGDIPKLTEPILREQADMVVGARSINDIAHFSPIKKFLQNLGSTVVRWASGTSVPDAPSGFRAVSRDCAMRLNVFNRYTYTLETLIQAGRHGMKVVSVPVRTNGPTRPSRLMKSMRSYIVRSMGTIVRIFVLYNPLRFFFWVGLGPLVAGSFLFFRWLFLYLTEEVYHSRIPSLLLGSLLMIVGFLTWCVGLLADLLSANRRILEEIRIRQRRMDNTPLVARDFDGSDAADSRTDKPTAEAPSLHGAGDDAHAPEAFT